MASATKEKDQTILLAIPYARKDHILLRKKGGNKSDTVRPVLRS